MPEIIKIILTLLIVGYFSKLINCGVMLWQVLPITEVSEPPFYITKDITNDIYNK